MIRYALHCDQAHAFESWFSESRSFDELAAAGHVACPQCGSLKVEKALMAPAVVTARRRAAVAGSASESVPAPTPAPMVLADERAKKVRSMVRELREHLTRESRDVGSGFADEARRIHDGVSDNKAVHGVASADDVRALLDEGVPIMPLPVLPDEMN